MTEWVSILPCKDEFSEDCFAWVDSYIDNLITDPSDILEPLPFKAITEFYLFLRFFYPERLLGKHKSAANDALYKYDASVGLDPEEFIHYSAFFQNIKLCENIIAKARCPEHVFVLSEITEICFSEYWQNEASAAIASLLGGSIVSRADVYRWTHSIFFASQFGEVQLSGGCWSLTAKVGAALVVQLCKLEEWDLLLEVFLALEFLNCPVPMKNYKNIRFPVVENLGIYSEGTPSGAINTSPDTRYSCFHTTCIFLALRRYIFSKKTKSTSKGQQILFP